MPIYNSHENDKKIILDFFIYEKTENKKQNFADFKIKIAYLSEEDKSQYFSDIFKSDNGDNLITFLFSQPKFVPSNTKIKHLKDLGLNWKHTNNLGQNLLHLHYIYNNNFLNSSWISKMYSTNELTPDDFILDINNKHYSYYLLERILGIFNDDHKGGAFKRLRLNESLTHLKLSDALLIPIHYSNQFSELSKKELAELLIKSDTFIEKYETNSSKENLSELVKYMKDTTQKLKNMLQYHYLNKDLPVNSKKTAIKKI